MPAASHERQVERIGAGQRLRTLPCHLFVFEHPLRHALFPIHELASVLHLRRSLSSGNQKAVCACSGGLDVPASGLENGFRFLQCSQLAAHFVKRGRATLAVSRTLRRVP